MFQEGLFSYITAQASVTALLGTPSTRGDKSTGCFAMLATSEALLPYLVFQRVSGSYAQHYQGADPFMDSRWRITCYGSTQKNAALLADTIKSAFKTFTGALPDGTLLQNAWLLLEADDTEAPLKGTVYAVHLDYQFQFIDATL